MSNKAEQALNVIEQHIGDLDEIGAISVINHIMSKKKYPDTTSNCPHCDSPKISGWEWEADGTEAWQIIRCDDCGKRWHNVYNFAGYEED